MLSAPVPALEPAVEVEAPALPLVEVLAEAPTVEQVEAEASVEGLQVEPISAARAAGGLIGYERISLADDQRCAG